jgi:hypothetical protein
MIINEGSTTPKVATIEPRILPEVTVEPIYVAILIAIGPGVDSHTPIKLVNISKDNQPLEIHTSLTKGIIAKPPPKVNKPILKNSKNNSK